MTAIVTPLGQMGGRVAAALGLIVSLVLLSGCGTSAPPPEAGSNPFEAAARTGSAPSKTNTTVAVAPATSKGESGAPDGSAGNNGAQTSFPPVENSAVAKVASTRPGPSTKRSVPSLAHADGSETPAETAATVESALPVEPAPLPAGASSPDWPQFRGPAGTGVAVRSGLPVSWNERDNIDWKIRIRGMGASSPIVQGDYVLVSYYRGYGVGEASTKSNPQRLTRHVACYNRATGRQKWDHAVQFVQADQPYQGFITQHGYASSTPVTDGETVYACFGVNGVCAIDLLSGRREWNTPIGSEKHEWGSGSSPILYNNTVIVNAAPEAGALGALSQSGNVLWSVEGITQSWATPVLVEAPNGDQELVLSMHNKIAGYSPVDGTELWACLGIGDYVCPSIVAAGGVVYAIGGRSGNAIAIRAGGRGDVTQTHVLWRTPKGSNVSSPVVYNGYLFWVSDKGIAYCLDARTGEVLTERRADTGEVYASMVAADDKLYVVSRRNGTFVFSATPEMSELARNTIGSDESEFNASPALAGGQIFLRSNEFLYCIGRPQQTAAENASASRE